MTTRPSYKKPITKFDSIKANSKTIEESNGETYLFFVNVLHITPVEKVKIIDDYTVEATVVTEFKERFFNGVEKHKNRVIGIDQMNGNGISIRIPTNRRFEWMEDKRDYLKFRIIVT